MKTLDFLNNGLSFFKSFKVLYMPNKREGKLKTVCFFYKPSIGCFFSFFFFALRSTFFSIGPFTILIKLFKDDSYLNNYSLKRKRQNGRW